MRTGKGRAGVESMQAPIALGGIQVRAGDILIGDADGILVIPRVRESEIFETAREIEEAEQAIERETAKRLRLDEARPAFRYHQLQTHGAQKSYSLSSPKSWSTAASHAGSTAPR